MRERERSNYSTELSPDEFVSPQKRSSSGVLESARAPSSPFSPDSCERSRFRIVAWLGSYRNCVFFVFGLEGFKLAALA